MVNQDCILVCTTVSEHSFLSKEASFVNLKNDFPVFFALSKEQLIFIIKDVKNNFFNNFRVINKGFYSFDCDLCCFLFWKIEIAS